MNLNTHYRNQIVTHYITYLNLWGALSRTLSSLSTHEDMIIESSPHLVN
jgi:hypothetical protein